MENPKKAHDKLITNANSSLTGFTLTGVKKLADQLGMNYRMAKRSPGAEFIVPSVVHWKSGHFAALLKKQGGYYVTKDPTFGQSLLVTSQALEDEASDYFLIPAGPLPAGWQSVEEVEGNGIKGRGVTSYAIATATKPNDKKTCPLQGSGGMAVYDILLMLVSLSVQDTPVGYAPPVGPDMHFTVTYNELEADQPSNFSFFNFGPCWNCNWLSYVTVPTATGGTAYVNVRGGGQETYSNSQYVSTGSTYPGYVGYYGYEPQSQAALWVTAAGTYERRLPDGSEEVFGNIDSAGFVFLTKIIDPQGNALTLGYDSSYRLTTLTDALGLQTNLTYGLPGDGLKVTQITDPYGRSAYFAYTSATPYQLVKITDVAGINSQFTYASGSVMGQMKTPYGTTVFSYTSSSYSGYTGSAPQVSALTVTEPDGSQVKAERRLDGTNYPYFPPGTTWTAGENAAIQSTEPEPGGYGLVGSADDYLQYRNTYYWDKKATHDVPGCLTDDPASYASAYIYHWLHTPDDLGVSPILESEKPALENRIWYTYPGQGYITYDEGSSSLPLQVIRVLNNSHPNICQAWAYTYSSTALTSATDPQGRQTAYDYASNGIDVTQVIQINGSGYDSLREYSYNSQHEPLTVTDAAGQVTNYAYNAQGQVLSITPPVRAGRGTETVRYSYTNNYLTGITDPLAGSTTSITCDTLGGKTMNRVKIISDPEGYARTYSYDNLDRVVQISYPDGTSDAFSYVNPSGQVDLDLHKSTDRLGLATTRTYDSTRHLTSTTDPLNRTTSYTWCSCGSLMSLTDPKGNVTAFNRDLEGRLISKIYPDSHSTVSTYDAVRGLLATQTDARGDVASYSYNADNTLSGISYSTVSGTAATPNVACAYDSIYPRLTSVGGISYAYGQVGSLGANQVKTVTNALSGASPVITYIYDEWGRRIGRSIDSNNNLSITLDSLGRVANVTNALCPSGTSFTYAYFDPTHPTPRIGSITYPNGQITSYNYLGNTGDERMQEIKNFTPAGAVMSQDDYTYNAVGDILTWQRQSDGRTPLLWTLGYDAADQLTSAVQTNTAIPSPAVAQDSYTYDAVGNATAMNLAGVGRSSTFNNLNQLTGSTVGGNQAIQVTGSVSAPSTISINGSAASMSGTNFIGAVSLPPGSTNTIAVVATDSSGNSRTNKYQTVVPAQPGYSPTYDADGNELSNGAGQTYTWDAKNELASITYASGAASNFTYDALGRRIAMIEKSSAGTVTGTKQFVWDGDTLAEERDASGTNVTKRFFTQGEQIGGTGYYYTRDHLGSVREMTDSNGTIQARYDYDPYGRTTLVSGTNLSDFQYAGYYEHQPSGLALTMFRAYDPLVARWLSRDPIGEDGGINLYGYVGNSPVDMTDPLGLTGASGVVGTVFSGPGDPNNSAYTGQPVDPTQPGASLPFKFPHSPGQLPGKCIKITSRTTGKSTVAPIVDVGPHSTNNPYWNSPNGDSTSGNSVNRSGLDMTPSTGSSMGLPVTPGRPGHAPAFNTPGDELFDFEFVPCPCKK